MSLTFKEMYTADVYAYLRDDIGIDFTAFDSVPPIDAELVSIMTHYGILMYVPNAFEYWLNTMEKWLQMLGDYDLFVDDAIKFGRWENLRVLVLFERKGCDRKLSAVAIGKIGGTPDGAHILAD